MTPVWVLSGQATTITKPVAASTMVQIATFPAAERGMSTRSKCSLSPNTLATGLMGCKGTSVFGLAGLTLAQMSHDAM